MKRSLQRIAAIFVLVCLNVPVIGKTAAEAEISYLIEFVAQSGCAFERNGRVYDAGRAASHLNLKYQRGRRYADSAEHFIDRVASKSSFSGKPYYISCPDADRATAKAWLYQALLAYRK